MGAEGGSETMGKLRIGLLFGGRSVEHDVSIVSAASILQALDKARYDVSLIAVDRRGGWHLEKSSAQLQAVCEEGAAVTLPPSPGSSTMLPLPTSTGIESHSKPLDLTVDVVIPIIHGRGGEDGTLQGLLELAEVPYVGSGVLSSAVQMDKDFAKRLLVAAGLPVVPWVVLQTHTYEKGPISSAVEAVSKELEYPVFVKPANSGSSVGINRATSDDELAAALIEAARYDTKVIVERGLNAREIEVAVLGNESPEASVPGEIMPSNEFYDYEAKYHDDATELKIPADLSNEESRNLQDLAIRAFEALDAEGLARVDFLVDRQSGEVFINELNSLPGFTSGSMYPLLWQATGLPYSQLLDRLIDLALDRHRRHQKLETSFDRHAGPREDLLE